MGNHALALDALVPGRLDDTSARLDYSYNRLWPSFGLTLARSAGLACDLIVDGSRTCYRQHGASGVERHAHDGRGFDEGRHHERHRLSARRRPPR